MREVVIVAATRTPIGRAPRGTLAAVRPDDLAVTALVSLMERSGLDPKLVDDLILGCAFPEGEQGMNMARQVGLIAGLPVETSAMTVNRFCSSGLESVHLAALKIATSHADCIVAGGSESMSQIPMGGSEYRPNPVLAAETPDSYLNMGLTAERVAAQEDVSREDQDTFALQSHERALAAQKNGLFDEQITPVRFERVRPSGKDAGLAREEVIFDKDEGPRAGGSLEALAKLRPVFQQGGTVTAGNSSQMSDGAAVLLVCSREFAEAQGLKPMARYLGYATAGIAPEIMGLGPVNAVPKLLAQTGVALGEIELIELNEAFAAQGLAVMRRLGLNPEITNVNGGAIAMGHPLGCTGAKLSVQAIYELGRRGGRYAMVTMCIGGGMGAAGLFENLQ